MTIRKSPAARIALVAAVVLALVLVPAALAGKGSGGASKPGGGGHKGGGGSGSGSSSLSLVMVTDQNGDGLPNWGDTITFGVSSTQTTQPYVQLTCSQNGTVVYSAWAGFYDGYLWPAQQFMPLSSPSWTGGAASCTAVMNDGLATLSFGVGA